MMKQAEVTVVVTPAGYQELVNRLAELDRCVKEARASVSEESEYLRFLSIMRNHNMVTLVEQAEEVKAGNGVELLYPDGTRARFIIDGFRVGFNPHHASLNAPLAQAILGARRGDMRQFETPKNGIKSVTVVQIVPPSQAEAFCRELENKTPQAEQRFEDSTFAEMLVMMTAASSSLRARELSCVAP